MLLGLPVASCRSQEEVLAGQCGVFPRVGETTMSRPQKPDTPINKIKYVRVAYYSGLLESRGAQAELGRMLGVTRQYINALTRQVAAEGVPAQIARIHDHEAS